MAQQLTAFAPATGCMAFRLVSVLEMKVRTDRPGWRTTVL